MSKNNGYILKWRQSRLFKGMAVCVLLNFLVEIVQPMAAYALTEGPSQPEVQSFEPIGTTQMVDLFSGDFNYNIPLFNLPGPNGGYPVNLAYHAAPTMDDEASWVGLGWNINVGSLVRSVRGLPDEFQSTLVSGSDDEANENSDYVLVKTDVKQNWTLGLTTGVAVETVGADLASLADLAGLGLSASVYYNNYNGIGVTLGASYGLSAGETPLSLGLSLDSENGVGVSASASMSTGIKDATERKYSLGFNFDGRLSVDYSMSNRYYSSNGKKLLDQKSIGSSISFARSNFSPSQAFRVNSYSLSFTVKGGAELGVVAAGWSGGIFFDTQDMDDKDKSGRRLPVLGYTQSGAIDAQTAKKYTLDYTRANDGQITKANMFLPHTYYNYDVYNSTGQGLAGYFRPRRSDIGRVYDPENVNNTFGTNLTLDFAAGSTAKFGMGAGLTYGHSKQGPWDDDNSFRLNFKTPTYLGSLKENVYFQAHGEQTILDNDELNHINGLELPFVRLAPNESGDGVAAKRKMSQASTSSPNDFYSDERQVGDRVVRNTTIHNLTNSEVANLGEFAVRYRTFDFVNDKVGTTEYSLTRDVRNGVSISKHPAGYKVLNQDGTYYTYGLPAYNVKEVENLFSVDQPTNPSQTDRVPITVSNGEVDYQIGGTDKFIRKTSKSPYAHSYLMTSVQGADYVDITNDGPTDDDLGYWVKFGYVRYATNCKWRAPYTQAMYNRGAHYTPEDDKASYQYGEKELWYTDRIETKSHIAIFHLSERDDMREAGGEYGGNGSLHGLKIDSIEVFEKKAFNELGEDAVALQTIHFSYDYSLCTNSPNSDATNDGKLTLKALWFTSNGSTRGEKSKYTFDYGTGLSGFVNPSYRENAYDSWGTYKGLVANYNMEHASQLPYVNQFNQDWGADVWEPAYGTNLVNQATKDLTRETQGQLASVWCLRKIGLPSGGEINIEYESDDYGYVQHKTANQMFKIHSMADLTDPEKVYSLDDELGGYHDDGSWADEANRRIYFKLEEPILAGTGNPGLIIYNDYVRPMIRDENDERNLYFKVKMKLVNDISEYLSGYLPLEDYNENNYGVAPTASSHHYYGYITIKAAVKKKKENNVTKYFDQYHPLALAGWTYLQTNAQKLLNNPNSFEQGGNFNSPNDLLGAMADLMNIAPATASNFGLIRSYCKGQGMARFIDLDHSCIRLASPDKIKYGGGHRVKQISITDNWSSDVSGETNRTYGQEYDYTMYEGEDLISSGVAQYEPQAGGDENPLKYPIYYFEKASVFTKNNLFSEAPMNEALFPGASVGYRQVTVRSINTGTQQRNAASGPTQPVGRTGGITVHEFYTAKDFPTLVEYSTLKEENHTKDVKNINIPMPLIGSIKRSLYHGTQAYKIELNDMHGKPKSVKTYELNNYLQNTSPITETIYEYQMDPIFYQDEKVWKLNNYVKVIEDNNEASVYESTGVKLMGIEYDMFTDQRQNTTYHFSSNFDANIDVASYPIPFPSFWPQVSKAETTFRTYVTNKVIHRSGILKRTVSRDLQTVNETEILAYDEKSGQPLLSKVKNEFGDDFFNYNIPAYYVYENMGHAYRNINFTFTTNLSEPSHAHDENLVKFIPNQNQLDALVRGDELLVTQSGNPNLTYRKGNFIGWKYHCGNGTTVIEGLIHFPEISNGALNGGSQLNDVTLKVIRSGRRNHYSSMAASYLTKGKIPTNLEDASLTQSNVSGDATEIVTKKLPADMVLSASATVYREDWSLSNHIYDPRIEKTTGQQPETGHELAQGAERIVNPYITGTSGIWRPLKTYTYVGERKTTGNMYNNQAADPNLRNDGVFSVSVPLFTWEIGNLEDYIPQWEWVNEVTRFSHDSYEVENRNRLDIRSSALYGYDNSLSIAVGGNAGYYEIGVDDFETAPATNWHNQDRIVQNHLNFHTIPDDDGVVISEKVEIKDAIYDCNGLLTFKIKKPTDYVKYFFDHAEYENINSTMSTFGLALVSRKNAVMAGNKNFFFNGSLSSSELATVNGEEQLTVSIKPYYHCADEPALVLAENTEFTGSLSLYERREFIPSTFTNYVLATTEKAHTGKRSLRLVSGGPELIFDQPMLRTIMDKTYVVSCWISRENEDVSTYKPSSGNLLTPGYLMGTTFIALGSNDYKVTYGKIVEGWQKIDIEYALSGINDIVAFKFDPQGSPLFVDDFRVSPKTGGMTTYVYDKDKFWLRASLNVDNYATLYFYDEEGNLTIKKQETEKGIFTVTESRGHISEQP